MTDLRVRRAVESTWLQPRSAPCTGLRRGPALSDLELACRAGSYDLNVLIRDLERPRGVEIIGQVTRADDAHIPASNVEVALVSPDGTTSLEAVRTSAFGEFYFPRRAADVLGLRLGTSDDAPIILVWDRRL